MLFVCPKCKQPFAKLENCGSVSVKCPSGHCFDRAAAGYYNFLLGAGGGVHGDNAQMVRARRDFLSGGHYEPLARRVADLALMHTGAHGAVLDAGCGEGYYTSYIENKLFSRDGDSRVFAFDVSKDAAKRAARLNPRLTVAVASSYSMPIPDGCIDTAINLFSPMAKEEVLRVLKTGGRFIFVFPAEEHLFGLKAAIYDTPYKNRPESTELQGFKLLSEEELRYTLTLEGKEQISSLFLMTPYAYRTSRQGRERVEALERLETEVHFRLACYEKL